MSDRGSPHLLACQRARLPRRPRTPVASRLHCVPCGSQTKEFSAFDESPFMFLIMHHGCLIMSLHAHAGAPDRESAQPFVLQLSVPRKRTHSTWLKYAWRPDSNDYDMKNVYQPSQPCVFKSSEHEGVHMRPSYLDQLCISKNAKLM